MAVDTLRPKKAVQLVEMGKIVHLDRKLDMSRVAGTRPAGHATSRAACDRQYSTESYGTADLVASRNNAENHREKVLTYGHPMRP